MKSRLFPWQRVHGLYLAACLSLIPLSMTPAQEALLFRQTTVSIVGRDFFINGEPTYAGRTWNGHRIEGLLLNSRMVQGIFDDLNPETRPRWAYPDTRTWDPDRNTREFVAAMSRWKDHGLLAFTVNLQGGSPEGYSREQPWHNSAFEADGSLRPDSMARLERILEEADKLGMAVILGYFYFGQDERLRDEAAVIQAVDNATKWILERGYKNVLVEVNNECNVARYEHDILKPDRVHELITRVRNTTLRGRRLYAGTSYGGGRVPDPNVIRVSDFILLHGNGVDEPERIAHMVRRTRESFGYRSQPIVFNEDDHFDFDQPTNNFVAAIGEHASWGFFDPGESNYRDGYQCPPVNWNINTDRKRAFFTLVSEMAGVKPPVEADTPAAAPRVATGEVRLRRDTWRGWPGAIFLNNGLVEAVIVPSIGRIMQFRFVGEAEGPFWENPNTEGWQTRPDGREWINFGGDKSWPAPQSDWAARTPRAWPPPPAFDQAEHAALIDGGTVTLVSPVDPHYGIRSHRTIRLDPNRSFMTVNTSYEKVIGEPVRVSVWVITQLKEPLGVFVPVAASSRFSGGYTLLSEAPPPGMELKDGLLTVKRNPARSHKIGSDAGTLVWVGERSVLRMDSPRVRGASYPDNGSSAEVYTSADPLPYVELEMLGPLESLRVGERLDQACVYTLLERTEDLPEAEARKVLAR